MFDNVSMSDNEAYVTYYVNHALTTYGHGTHTHKGSLPPLVFDPAARGTSHPGEWGHGKPVWVRVFRVGRGGR